MEIVLKNLIVSTGAVEMTYRSDLDAANARADAAKQENKELKVFSSKVEELERGFELRIDRLKGVCCVIVIIIAILIVVGGSVAADLNARMTELELSDKSRSACEETSVTNSPLKIEVRGEFECPIEITHTRILNLSELE